MPSTIDHSNGKLGYKENLTCKQLENLIKEASRKLKNKQVENLIKEKFRFYPTSSSKKQPKTY